MPLDVHRTIEAVWRIEGPRIVGALARMTGDLAQAEDVAQDALAEALVGWPATGIPRNAGAWLTATAKRRAIDAWRRRERLDERHRILAHDLSAQHQQQDRIDEISGGEHQHRPGFRLRRRTPAGGAS